MSVSSGNVVPGLIFVLSKEVGIFGRRMTATLSGNKVVTRYPVQSCSVNGPLLSLQQICDGSGPFRTDASPNLGYRPVLGGQRLPRCDDYSGSTARGGNLEKHEVRCENSFDPDQGILALFLDVLDAEGKLSRK